MKPAPEELLREFAVELAYLLPETIYLSENETKKLVDDIETRLNALLDKLMPTTGDSFGKRVLLSKAVREKRIDTPEALRTFDKWFRSRMGGESK